MLTRRAKAYSMPMLIYNRFQERLANIGKIMNLQRYHFFDALMRMFPWTSKIETWTIEIYVQCWKSYTQLLHVYLNWFWRDLLLKYVSQPEIARKIH